MAGIKRMTLVNNLCKLSAVSALLLMLAGCAHIDIDKNKGGKTQAPPAGQTGTDTSAPQPGAANQLPSISGDWQFGFQFNNDTLQSTVHLDQQGQSFTGHGKDDQSGMGFSVEQGQITGNQVQFYKKYPGNSPEVEYTGTLEMANDAGYHGPYMHGEYTTGKAGKIVSNIWEAELAPPGSAPAAPPQQQQSPTFQPSGQQSASMLNHTPELSGKWNVAFEYNFRNIHSTMFLEQVSDRISGHGVDHDTKEKFIIDNGWYHYPKLTLIRKYPASKQTKMVKGKGKRAKPSKMTVNVPEHSMIFKARVSMVNDRDYQGPYLNGKTQGGGNWEAQMYK